MASIPLKKKNRGVSGKPSSTFLGQWGMFLRQFIKHPGMIGSVIHLPTRIVPSDRLPAYSEVTMDIEVDNDDKWMEVCSISKRTDFPQRYRSHARKGPAIDHDVRVLEISDAPGNLTEFEPNIKLIANLHGALLLIFVDFLVHS